MRKIVCVLVGLLFVLGLFACASSSTKTDSVQQSVDREQIQVRTDGLEVKVFPQLGHSSGISSLSFSPNGKYIVSSSYDNTVKLWDIDSGKEIRTFFGHSGEVNTVSFRPDGKYITSGGNDNYLKVWEIDTGKEKRTNTSSSSNQHSYGVWSAVFSPDGKYIASGAWDTTIKLRETETGRVIYTFPGNSGPVLSVAYSPDGNYIASGSWDSTIRLWNTVTGREIRIFSGHSGIIRSVTFSSDGKQILSGSGGTSIDRDNRIISSLQYSTSITSARFSIRLWDIVSGEEINNFSGHSAPINSVVYSPDGKQIVSGSDDRTVKLWDVDSGKEIKTFFGHSGIVRSVAFSPDGKYIASGSGDTIKLWDAASGEEIRTFSKYTKSIRSVSISSDGKYIAAGSSSNDCSVILWDAASGNKIEAFSGHSDGFIPLTFSSDGKLIVSGGGYNDRTIKLWDVVSGGEARTFSASSGVNSVAISPDGKHIASAGTNVEVWDMVSGEKIITITGHRFGARSVEFSPDGKHIASSDGTTKLWSILGEEIRTFSNRYGNYYITFSPDGKQIAMSGTGPITLWDVDSGKEIKAFSISSEPRSLAFSPDGKYIASGYVDNTIKLWDVTTNEFKVFHGHLGTVFSTVFSSNGNYIVSSSDDGTTRLWDVASGKEIASFISFTDGEWIVVTPDGYYNSSPKGDQYLNVRIGNEVYGMNQFAGAFYQPEVVQARLQGLPDPPIVKERGSIQTTSIPPVIRVTPSEIDPLTKQITLSITAADPNRQINNIEIIVNGRRIGGSELQAAATTTLRPTRALLTPASNERQFEFTIPLTLDPGANHIEIVASNGYNFGLRPLYLSIPFSNTIPKGDLWVFAVGVDKYENNNIDSGYLDLRNPSTDAGRIVSSFRAQEGKRYDKVHVLSISDRDTILPTKQAIMENMNEFFSKAGLHDTVVLFMSGHGKTEDGIYYFMPRDTVFLGDEKFALDSVISVNELSEALNIPGRKIVMLDTCESGGVDSNRLTHSLRNRSTVVFTASQDGEFALDTTLYGGLLAYSVAEGVTGKAATEGTVQIEPLGRHVIQQVRELSRDRQSGVIRQTPVVYFPDWYKNFEIAW